MQRVWVVIISIAVVLFSILGYLGFKYYKIINSPVINKKMVNTTSPEPTIDPFVNRDITEYTGKVICLYPNNPEDCTMSLRLDGGDEYILGFTLPNQSNQLQIGDLVKIVGFISEKPNIGSYKSLSVKEFVKL